MTPVRLSARLDQRSADLLALYCSKNRCTRSVAIRSAIGGALGNADSEASRVFDAIVEALGLSGDASGEEIVDSIEALLKELEADEAAQPAPKPTVSASRARAIAAGEAALASRRAKPLSKEALAYCAKQRITHAEFAARKARAVRSR